MPDKSDRTKTKNTANLPLNIEKIKKAKIASLKKRRQQKKFLIWIGRFRLLLKFASVIGLAYLLWYIIVSPLWVFDGATLEIHNNHLLSRHSIEALITPLKGKPLYSIHTGAIAQKIATQFDIVQHVTVRRQLFPTPKLHIQIIEKEPWAKLLISPNSSVPYAIATNNSKLSLKSYTYNFQKPLTSIIVSPAVSIQYLKRLQKLSWQTHQIPGLHLDSIDARNRKAVVLNFKEIPVIVGSLNADVEDRLARLLQLLPTIQKYKDSITSVDLQWGEQILFHRKDSAGPIELAE